MEKIYVKHLVDDEIKYPSEEYFFHHQFFIQSINIRISLKLKIEYMI